MEKPEGYVEPVRKPRTEHRDGDRRGDFRGGDRRSDSRGGDRRYGDRRDGRREGGFHRDDFKPRGEHNASSEESTPTPNEE